MLHFINRAIPVIALTLVSLHAVGAEELSLVVTAVGSTLQLPAVLIKPDGEGPFPAVVIAHDCSGLGARSSGAPRRWAGELVQQGYVVLIPDSFSPRGFADGVCFIPGTQTASVYGDVRAADAYGALTALRALPYIDGKRIGIMGGSHGGSTTLAAMVAASDSYAPPDGFIAAIALYPSCSARYGTWSTVQQYGSYGPVTGYAGVYHPLAPLLILTG